eukprot:scaffold80971_cov51-Phaeocystis_antarctica.AAC.2
MRTRTRGILGQSRVVRTDVSAERAAREATSLLRVLAASCYAGSGLSRLGTQAASRAGRSARGRRAPRAAQELESAREVECAIIPYEHR